MRKLPAFFLLLSFHIHSQSLIQGIGIFGSVTSNKHRYNNLDHDLRELPGNDTNKVMSHHYPQSHISKELIRWGAGIFAEIGRSSRVRWQTELEYINTGASEMQVLDIYFTGERSGVYTPNKTTYIQWNNYLKFFNPIFNRAKWYFMAGVRAEYLFRNTPTVYPDAVLSFPKFWFSGDLGLGYEFPLVRRLSAFIEYHWNPDIWHHKFLSTNIRRRTHEARVGVVLRPRQRRVDDCNAPVYKGPAY